MAKTSPNKRKKARYAIGDVSMNDFSKIIREFEKLPYKSYERRSPKHEPTNSRQLLLPSRTACEVYDDI